MTRVGTKTGPEFGDFFVITLDVILPGKFDGKSYFRE